MTLMERIAEYLMRWATKRGRVFDITGTAGPEDLYLRRFYIIKSQYFNFFIHLFFRSDRDDLHDHPWDFCTYLIRGAYTEHKWNEKAQRVEETRRANYLSVAGDRNAAGMIFNGRPVRIKQNRLVFRRATDQHKVVVDFDVDAKSPGLAALTFCFTGPTRREWGFIVESNCQGRIWVNWKKYLGLPEDAKSRG